MPMRVAICPASHLLRVPWSPAGGEPLRTVRCPQCAATVRVRLVDSRMLSQDGLVEAWRHRSR